MDTFDLCDIIPQTSIYIGGGGSGGKSYLARNIKHILQMKYNVESISLHVSQLLNGSLQLIYLVSEERLPYGDYSIYLNNVLQQKLYHNVVFTYSLMPFGIAKVLTEFDILFIENRESYLYKKYICDTYYNNNPPFNCDDIFNNYDESYGFIVLQKDKPLQTCRAESPDTFHKIVYNNNLSYKDIDTLLNKIKNGYSMYYNPYNDLWNVLYNKLEDKKKKFSYILWCVQNSVNYDMWLPSDVNLMILWMVVFT